LKRKKVDVVIKASAERGKISRSAYRQHGNFLMRKNVPVLAIPLKLNQLSKKNCSCFMIIRTDSAKRIEKHQVVCRNVKAEVKC